MGIGTQGIFLGGVASGQRAAHTMGINERGLALQEQQFEATERQQLTEQARTDYANTFGIVENLVNSFNGTTEEFWAQHGGMMEELSRELSLLGESTGTPMAATLAALDSLQTRMDQKSAEARAGAAGMVAEAKALEEFGIPAERAQIIAGLMAEPTDFEKKIATLQEQGVPVDGRTLLVMAGGPDTLADARAAAQLQATLQSNNFQQYNTLLGNLQSGVNNNPGILDTPEGQAALAQVVAAGSRVGIDPALTVASMQPAQPTQPSPQTNIAKIRTDIENGLVEPEEGAVLIAAELTGVDEEGRDEFTRNMRRVLALEQKRDGEGLTDAEQREYEILGDRLERQTEGTPGLAIRFDPETGAFTVSQGPNASEGLGAALTASQLLTQQARSDRLQTVIGTVDQVISSIQEDPTRAGIIGSVRRFTQNLIGVGSDIGAGAIAKTAVNSLSELPGIDRSQIAEVGSSFFFDSKLSEMDIMENTIALELAKLRILSGDSSIRAISEVLNQAKKDVNLSGFTFGEDVISRLRSIRAEFEIELANLQRRVGTQTTQQGTADPSQMSDEELIQFLGGQ